MPTDKKLDTFINDLMSKGLDASLEEIGNMMASKAETLKQKGRDNIYPYAPNGKHTNLTEEQYALVRTDSFKKWFGDWQDNPMTASRMVDKNGEPKVFYHGSDKSFDSFDLDFAQSSSRQNTLGKGFYFTDSKSNAMSYGKNVYAVFLNLRNPDSVSDATYYKLSTMDSAEFSEDRRNELIEDGYDGSVCSFPDETIALALYPNQAKSSTENNGNFNSEKVSLKEEVLLAPNGKPSNLNEKQWHQVRTPQFKKWFGDWENDPEHSSKVVDENGEPLVVYHGSRTGGNFNIFDGDYYFFTDKQEIADMFLMESEFSISIGDENSQNIDYQSASELIDILTMGDYSLEELGDSIIRGSNYETDEIEEINYLLERSNIAYLFPEGFNEESKISINRNNQSIYNVFLNIKNPLQKDYKGAVWNTNNMPEQYVLGAKNSNFDGIIIENIVEGGYSAELRNGEEPPVGTDYIAFKPNQIKSATDNNGNFDLERKSIKESAELLAPNGKPSNLNDKQWHMVRTPQFKKWFGDWENDPADASQIVDENGEPKVMYHGTPHHNKFDTFNDSHLLWFTDKKEFARDFVGRSLSPNIMEVFLNVRNPRIYTRMEKEELEALQKDFEEKLARFEAGEESLESELEAMNDILNLHDTPKTDSYEIFEHDYLGNCHGDTGYKEDCRRNHQDGAIIVDTMWDSGMNHGEPNSQWVVFDSTQVKSATDNNGDFNSQSKSIKESSKLLAPNGKPSNLTSKQWYMVRTPQFKKWFGDWENNPSEASKIVDENGEPKVMFHGGGNNFDTFDLAKAGQSNSNASIGFWFADSKEFAEGWLNDDWNFHVRKPIIYQVFLNLRNPKIFKPRQVDKATVDAFNKKIDSKKAELASMRDTFEKEHHKFYQLTQGIHDYTKGTIHDLEDLEAKAIIDKQKQCKTEIDALVEEVGSSLENTWDEDSDLFSDFYSFTEGYIEATEELRARFPKQMEQVETLKKEQDYLQQQLHQHILDSSEETVTQHDIWEVEVELKHLEQDSIGEEYLDPYEQFEIELYRANGLTAENAMRHSAFSTYANKESDEATETYRNALIAQGYDGIVIEKTSYDASLLKTDFDNQLVVFKANQIKSATDNNGNFDSNNASIKESTELLAPNGKPTHLTNEQWHMVRTPQFKKWFGDWESNPSEASKAVDENGEPMVMYHGTKAIFDTFDKSRSGESWKGYTKYGEGMYFTSSEEDALFWGKQNKANGSPHVMQVFLNLRNPLLDVRSFIDDYDKQFHDYKVHDPFMEKSIEDLGFDGIWDNKYNYDGAIEAMTANANQIKSATDNNGNFNLEKKSIRESAELLAPNGKPSNLNEKQWHQVRTPEFKAWFGDWESNAVNPIVLDSNGEPKIFYHGTNADFDAFSYKYIGRNGTSEGVGFYFTDDKDTALGYTRNGKVYECFLSIDKIINANDKMPSIPQVKRIISQTMESELKKYASDYDYEDSWKDTSLMCQFPELYNSDYTLAQGISYASSKYRELCREYSDGSLRGFIDVMIDYAGSNLESLLLSISNVLGVDALVSNGYENLGIGGGLIVVMINPFKIKSATNNNGNFSPSSSKLNESTLLAPNGRPSNLTEEQWHMVRTPQFKSWFGDWELEPRNASKVVDENGEPLIVYHGTGDINFAEFQIGTGAYYGGGLYFAKSKKAAEKYASNDGRVIEAFLNIRNPNVVGSPEDYRWIANNSEKVSAFEKSVDDYVKDAYDTKLNESLVNNMLLGQQRKLSMTDVALSKRIEDINRIFIKETSFDGLTIPYRGIFVALVPEQVKSATDNNGNFDLNAKSIKESEDSSKEDTEDNMRYKGKVMKEQRVKHILESKVNHILDFDFTDISLRELRQLKNDIADFFYIVYNYEQSIIDSTKQDLLKEMKGKGINSIIADAYDYLYNVDGDEETLQRFIDLVIGYTR